MITLEALPAVLIVAGVIPLAWSAAACVAHVAAARAPGAGDMRRETLVLVLMIAPVAVGAALLVVAHFAPEAPLPVLDLGQLGLNAQSLTSEANGATAPPPDAAAWLSPSFAAGVLALYFVGFAITAWRLLVARARFLRATSNSAAAPGIGERVRLTDEPVPPFAGAHGAIVLPRALAVSMSPDQIALIVRHEEAHLARGDQTAFHALAWIDAVLWFNPFVRHQTARCRLAAELACDAAVLSDEPGLRAEYARALLAALKQAAINGPRWAPASISAKGETRMRLIRILGAAPARARLPVKIAALLAGALVAPLTVVQLSFAQTSEVAQPASTVSAVPGGLNPRSPYCVHPRPATNASNEAG